MPDNASAIRRKAWPTVRDMGNSLQQIRIKKEKNMRAFKVMPKALRILAKKLTHLACNSRKILFLADKQQKTN